MYSDEGISGTSTKHREGFKTMVADALSGKIALIVTKSVSRFARNTVDSLTTIRKLKAKGIEVYFEKENIHTMDSKGEVLLTIMASLAQEESRSISEKVKWGHRKRFADGKEMVAFGRFLGYDRGEHGEFVINEEQAKVVKFIYGEYLTGLSYGAIAKKLMTLRIKAPGGKEKWHPQTVKRVLTNEKYAGDALLQKSYTPDYLSKKQIINHGEIPQYYVEDIHEAIIDKAQFRRVQDEIVRRNAAQHHSGVRIFSGHIFCGDCGGVYGSKIWHSTDKYRKVVWQCNDKYKRKSHCTTPRLTDEEICNAFLKIVNRLAPEREEITANLRMLEQLSCDTNVWETDLEKLHEELSDAYELMQNDIIQNARNTQNQAEYRENHDKLVSKYENILKKYKDTKEKLLRTEGRHREMDHFIQTIAAMPEVVHEFDSSLWATLVDHITVYSLGEIHFTLRDGTELKV